MLGRGALTPMGFKQNLHAGMLSVCHFIMAESGVVKKRAKVLIIKGF